MTGLFGWTRRKKKRGFEQKGSIDFFSFFYFGLRTNKSIRKQAQGALDVIDMPIIVIIHKETKEIVL